MKAAHKFTLAPDRVVHSPSRRMPWEMVSLYPLKSRRFQGHLSVLYVLKQEDYEYLRTRAMSALDLHESMSGDEKPNLGVSLKAKTQGDKEFFQLCSGTKKKKSTSSRIF